MIYNISDNIQTEAEIIKRMTSREYISMLRVKIELNKLKQNAITDGQNIS